MKSTEFITEWKKYDKVDPLLSQARKIATGEINKLSKEFRLRRRWSEWTDDKVAIQFWQRDNNYDPKTVTLTLEYQKLLRKLCRQLIKSPNIASAKVTPNALHRPDIIVTVSY